MILLGAVPVSLLALLFDFIFAKLEQAVTSEGLLPNEQIQNLPKKVIRRRQVIARGRVCRPGGGRHWRKPGQQEV